MVLLLAALAVLVVLVSSSLFTVNEWEKGLVFRFGEIVRADVEPGLHWKYPLISSARTFDTRNKTLDTQPEEYLTARKKNLVVDAYVKWRVDDAAKYYVTVGGSEAAAEKRLSQRVNDSLRVQFGKRTVEEVVSGERSEIMDVVQEAIEDQAGQIGVEIMDVRLKRVDLPDEVNDRVYARMRSERLRVAKQLRAEGAEQAEKIRADADRQRRVILANAQREAQTIRGQGDAVAAKVYADAFGQNEDFYELYRSLNAYVATFNDENDLLVLQPDSQFFKYFNDATPNAETSEEAAAPASEKPRS